MRAELVLAGHRRELVLDALCASRTCAFDEPGFDLELLVPASLRNALTTLAAALGILVAPGDAGHARRGVVRACRLRRVLDRVLDERVLDDLVLDAGSCGTRRGAWSPARRSFPCKSRKTAEVILSKRPLIVADLRRLCLRAFHQLSLLGLRATDTRGSILTPGPIVDVR